jgi:hypothetical protein
MKRSIIITTLFLLYAGWLTSQTSPTYTSISKYLQGVGSGSVAILSNINFPVTTKPVASLLQENNKSAKLYLKLDLGDDYVKANSGPWNFRIEVEISYQFGGNPPTVARTLTLTNNDPEMLRVDNVLTSININPSPAFTSTITNVLITDGVLPLTPGLLKDFIDKNLRLNVTLEREYEVDVRLLSNGFMSNPPVPYPVSITNRLVTFSWQPNGVPAYPNYEVQVLKVDNNDALYQTNPNQIVASVDWSKALKVETQSHLATVRLTMAEGTGYYIWRVRPIANYYSGGIANSENYGDWSYTVPSGTVALNKATLLNNNPTPYAFYFTDPDQNINWIYNRVFTEGDNYDKSNPTGVKTSEGMTYADGLQRIRQNQKYNSSENTNIVSQTINDYAGRPALATIPVPVAGGLTGYKAGFVKNTNNDLYTAEYFDEDSKINNPDMVKDNAGAYKYYSGNATSNPDPDNTNVPSAEGYPFKRTVYTTDGSSKVAEESGVGKAHSLGLQTNGKGRTTRILYSTPTDDELIHIFGDEAPIAESVVKTTTIDQNNVMSITYTSKEGKTIATALMSESADNLQSLPTPGQGTSSLTVVNAINENTSANGKLIASKRVAIAADNTTVTLTYQNDAVPAPGSGCASGNCNFKMRFYLIDLKSNTMYVSDADGTAGVTDFVVSGGSFSFPNGWRFVKISGSGASVINPVSGNPANMVLNSGEYNLIKEIYSGNAAGYAENIVTASSELTRPIFEAIAEQMRAVGSTGSYTTFTTYMTTFKTMVDNYNNSGGTNPNSNAMLTYLGIDPADMPLGYVFPFAADFSLSNITTSPTNPENNEIQMSTGCCGAMTVPFPKKDYICIPCEGSPDPAYQNTPTINAMVNANITRTSYGIDDLKNNPQWGNLTVTQKRSAVYNIVEREFIDALKARMAEEGFPQVDLWKLTPGFSFESLHFMIANMLISQYYAQSAMEHPQGSGNWFEATLLSNGTYSLGTTQIAPTSTAYPYNYDCKKIWEGWSTAIQMFNSFEASGGENIVNEFNDQDEPNSGQDNADNDDNWEDLSKREKKKLKKSLGTEVTDFSNSPEGSVSAARQQAGTNIINMFIEIVGYQFAAIIDGEPLPTHISQTNGVYPDDYFYTFSGPASGPPNIYAQFTINGGPVQTESPFSFSVDPSNGSAVTYTAMCNNNVINELYYPYIHKPEWMFKYYMYNKYENNNAGFLDDGDVLLPHQVIIDVQRNYMDPHSYLPAAVQATVTAADLCQQPVKPTYNYNGNPYTLQGYYHNNWTIEERGQFYQAIMGAPRCPKNKGVDVVTTQSGPVRQDYFDYSQQTPLPACESKSVLVQQGLDELNDRIQACYDMSTEIKQALTKELLSSCYQIVACKTGTGQVTEKEIDAMVLAVINSATVEINNIKNQYLAISTPYNNAVCLPQNLLPSTYNQTMCGLPSCSQVDCKEIVLYDDNSLDVVPSVKTSAKYFADCDQRLLDMIAQGVFLPYVPPLPNCVKDPKVWRDITCVPDNCGNEKTCPPSNFKSYSTTYTITAGN